MLPAAETVARGLEPVTRAAGAAQNSYILTLALMCFVINAVLLPTLRRLWHEEIKELNHRDSRSEITSNERWALGISMLQALLTVALTMMCALPRDGGYTLAGFGGLMILSALMLMLQLCGYALTSYAFAPRGETTSWVNGFCVSESMLGFALLIPSLGALFYPGAEIVFLIMSGVLFLVCRIPLYVKGFMIFYVTPFSIFYFFLYLCTLEIVPLLAAWSVAGMFYRLF